ncbi:MAG: HAMP domain-containing sensor histidine kinase [Flavobacteriaceae bacterium]|nr:HAMP domain-containing sensor histidine kinase [Flavobacteriaceae bacterium]
MNKKFFILILILMSLSLLGIISVQSYFIKSNIDKSMEQFALNINNILLEVSKDIQKREYSEYVYKFNELINSGVNIDTTAINNLYFISENNGSNETIIYRNGIIEESLKLPSFLDINIDSINITRISNEREQKIFSLSSNNTDTRQFTPEQLLLRIGEISRSKEILFETAYKDLAKRNPIHRRISQDEINSLITDALSEYNLNLNFEFGIFDKDLLTRVQSDNFDFSSWDRNLSFSTPIFTDNNNSSDFSINLYFPNLKNQFSASDYSYFEGIILSIVFTVIIIIVYISTISQLLKQKKIAQIKSDFINNMTHEFKTPIATINLVLDSIKNPKIIDNKELVINYLNMIKVENNRLNEQVENVLRISKLDKNELNIKRIDHDLHELIHSAVSHLDLIMKNKNGKIELELNSKFTNIKANQTHFTNAIINIIDNAIKYSENNPVIKISTRNVQKILNEKDIILTISDNGIGMSKDVQSKIFEKFYREQSGNLHNVKGHGLGLSYVKKIIKYHKGDISVSSSPGKGSSFEIKLPVYNKK